MLALGGDYNPVLDADETDFLIHLKVLNEAEKMWMERRADELNAISGAVVMKVLR